jgi:hypothetical protein|tara:strand:- start:69297 stop:70145 length:849 start_codon:yes stop_codon:yes gene_type:complete
MECKNCQKQLAPSDKFCGNCGARIVDQQLTYRYLANEMSERFFNVENNLILRTIKDMFVRPGAVIDGYIHGVRKRHLGVANYLALAITLSGLFLFIMQKFFQENMDMAWMGQEDNPMLQDTSWLDFMYEYQSIMYLAFIPFYALLAKLTFFNYRGRNNYLHHLIIATYSQAHISIVTFLPGILIMLLGINFFKYTYFFSFPLIIVYSAYVYKSFYQISLGKIIGKTLLFIVITSILYVGLWIGIYIILMLTGVIDFQEMMEAQKAAQEGTSYIASSVINWTS